MWCFLATSNDMHCVGVNRTGLLTHLPRSLTHVQHAPRFLTNVGNLRIGSMLAQYHRHTTHTGCWDELRAYCGAWSSSQRLRSR